MIAVLGVDAGSRTAADAEHLMLGIAAELGAGPGAVLCTHAVRHGTPHYAATVTLPAPPTTRWSRRGVEALSAASRRSGGRW
jgi:hypothetical protein